MPRVLTTLLLSLPLVCCVSLCGCGNKPADDENKPLTAEQMQKARVVPNRRKEEGN
jgi:hypothetical protein